MWVIQVRMLMPERSHKYVELKLWVSENTAISAHVSIYVSRKMFGGFALDPDWGAQGSYRPRPLLFKRRGQRLRAIEALETRAP